MAKYLICGLAYFDDEHFELTSANNPEHVVHLGAAASRCLRVLVDAKGQIVTKRDLLEGGWEQYGRVVSSNNVNQAIKHIRKCFDELGINADSIVTIPRIGYKTTDTFFVDDSAEVAQSLSMSPVFAEEIPPLATVPIPAAVSTVIRKRTFDWRKQWIYVALLVLLIINTIVAYMLAPMLQDNMLQASSFVVYNSVASSGAAKYYVQDGYSDRAGFAALRIDMLEKYPPGSGALESYRNIYINGAVFDKVFSYFLCRNSIESKDADCMSYMIFRGAEE